MGCASTKAAEKPKPPEDAIGRQVLATNAAHIDEYSVNGPRLHVYSLDWESATATTKDQRSYYVDAKGVSGTLYKDGVPSSSFKADRGFADRSAGILTLVGDVTVTALDGKAAESHGVMSCDRMTYSDEDLIVKASGNVRVVGDDFSFGPTDEIWCSNDLQIIASPSLFEAVRHNRKPVAPKSPNQ